MARSFCRYFRVGDAIYLRRMGNRNLHQKIMKILDNLYNCIVLAIGLLPVWYLVEKHGVKGFLSLIVETLQIFV